MGGRWGSSPLARGLLGNLRPQPDGRRIIPARAGFTGVRVHGARERADHPRSRGVYHVCVTRVTVRRRIIPARAGFTGVGPGVGGLRRDHPRSRGVYIPMVSSDARSGGSSPLARGLQVYPKLVWGHPGIIPARAGFTTPGTGWGRPSRDHPRSRGVYHARHGMGPSVQGSSPLARGLRRRG